MPKYLFNIEATIEVEADDEDSARDLFWVTLDHSNFATEVRLIDNDVMLMEVTD